MILFVLHYYATFIFSIYGMNDIDVEVVRLLLPLLVCRYPC